MSVKNSVYLDTTIISYFFDKKRTNIILFTNLTRSWWKTERNRYDLYLSSETLAELQQGHYSHQEEALRLAETIEILPKTDDIKKIAEVYLKHFLMPQTLEGDAVHLAYASLYKMDFLLTWNCKHLANANKTRHIRQVNGLLGLYTPEIITPLELFSEDSENDY